MDFGLRPLLNAHRIFASRDTEALRGFLATKDFTLDMRPQDAGSLDSVINGVYMPGMYLGYIQYGPSVEVRATARDDYWLQMPVTGKVEVIDRSHGVVCDTRRAALASPTHSDYYLVRSNEGCGGVRLCLYRSALNSCLTALLGDQPQKPLAFAPEMDLSEGHGRSLAQYILLAVRDLDQANAMVWPELTMIAFQNFVITALLMAQPHNFTAALDRLDQHVAPRDVKRAIEFIHANLAAPITMQDIVAITGVPGRTLFKHFRDYKGTAPMQYLRNARFEQVRRGLAAADPEASVTRIAMEAGFMHMGRFAIDYRRRFGECPSETLKRSRNAPRMAVTERGAMRIAPPRKAN